jgi:EAL domain-containing protein (putative c-di-GMP-specific phosphodiesterase class I)/DNA-binding NarL/FixJ family response regulator
MDGIKVLVADDEEGVRDVLAALIASDPTLTLVGSAAEADSAIALATEEQPDVALVDVRMPGGGGLRAAKEIVRRSSSTKVIAVSAQEDPQTVLSMLLAGASGYVAKSDPTDEILRTIHRTLEEPEYGTDEIQRILHTFDTCREHLDSRPDIHEMQRRRVQRALHKGGIAVALQPVLDLRTEEIAGAEATAVFRTGPERSSDSWFAEARAVDKLLALEMALVDAAIGQMGRLPDGAWMAIRVSPATVCASELEAAIAPVAERIVLLVSELDSIDDDEAFDAAIARLHDAGARMAADDSGTGIGSLRHIRRIRPDLVRLDETVTSRIERDEQAGAVTVTITSFCAGVGAEAIAKRVATRSAARALGEVGVRFAQGEFLPELSPSSDA